MAFEAALLLVNDIFPFIVLAAKADAAMIPRNNLSACAKKREMPRKLPHYIRLSFTRSALVVASCYLRHFQFTPRSDDDIVHAYKRIRTSLVEQDLQEVKGRGIRFNRFALRHLPYPSWSPLIWAGRHAAACTVAVYLVRQQSKGGRGSAT